MPYYSMARRHPDIGGHGTPHFASVSRVKPPASVLAASISEIRVLSTEILGSLKFMFQRPFTLSLLHSSIRCIWLKTPQPPMENHGKVEDRSPTLHCA